MCETASAVSSLNLRGVTAVYSTLQFAAAIKAVAKVVSFPTDARTFNVIAASHIKKFKNTNNFLFFPNYTFEKNNITKFTNLSKPKTIVEISTINDQKNNELKYSDTINKQIIVQKSLNSDITTKSLTSNKKKIKINTSVVLSSKKNSNIIKDSEFPQLGVRCLPSTNNDLLSNNYINTSHGTASPVVYTSGSNNIQHSSIQNAFFNRDTSVNLSKPYANLIRDSISLNTSSNEFCIQNEDFPALPVSQLSLPQNFQQNLKNNDNAHHESNLPEQKTIYSENSNNTTSERHYQQRTHNVKNSTENNSFIKFIEPDVLTNIPASMLNDQFGMAGLLTFVRAIDFDHSVLALALGHDLTNLGLNLNLNPSKNSRNLHQTFGGPWADVPCLIQDIHTKVPDEYLTNHLIRDKLPHIKLHKLSEDSLFYIFYNFPGELYQLAAVQELFNREWRFHKQEQVWISRFPTSNFEQAENFGQPIPYNVFDPVNWRKVLKTMILQVTQLEEKPNISSSIIGSGKNSSNNTGNAGNNVNTAAFVPRTLPMPSNVANNFQMSALQAHAAAALGHSQHGTPVNATITSLPQTLNNINGPLIMENIFDQNSNVGRK